MSLLASARGMAVGTVASRATGFLRTAALAAVLGVGTVGGLYDLANTTPNIVYELLLGGILTSIVVPLLVRSAKGDADAGQEYAQKLLTVVVVGLGLAVVALVVAAPFIVDLYAGNLSPADRRLAVLLARFFMPQVLFYGVGAVLGAVLNTRGRFTEVMWAPVVNNLVVLASCGLFLALPGVSPLRAGTITEAQIAVLGLGATVGIVAQTVALVPALRATGFRLRLVRDVRGVGLRGIASMARWTLLYVAFNQLAFLVVVHLSSTDRAQNAAGRGYASYVKAFVLWQLPHAVVAVSVITALLPLMSRAAADGDSREVRRQLDRGLTLTSVLLVPAAVGYLVLARDLSVAVFAHGRTSVPQAGFIGLLLAVFALGLVPFSAYQLQLRAFYAAGDTRTPALVNLAVNLTLVAVGLLLYVLLPPSLQVAGLVAGHTASFLVGLLLCSRVVRGRLGAGSRVVPRTAVRCLVASVIAALPAAGLVGLVHALLGSGPAVALLSLVAGGSVLLVGYVALARRMRVAEVDELLAPVLRRLGSSPLRR